MGITVKDITAKDITAKDVVATAHGAVRLVMVPHLGLTWSLNMALKCRK